MQKPSFRQNNRIFPKHLGFSYFCSQNETLMRIAALLPVIAFLGLILPSCQKELGFDQTTEPGKTGLLTRIQQGINPDLNEDTIYLLKYNASNKLIQIVDSVYQDTLNITHDANGNIKTATWTWIGAAATYTYNSSQQIQEINYTISSPEKLTFQYANGVISKGSFYLDPGSTGVASLLWNTFDFTVTAGNVTNLKVYDKNGTLVSDLTLTYGTQLNPFKELALLNMANYMGFNELFDINAIFSKNISTGYTTGSTVGKTQYTFNTGQQPTKAVCTANSYPDVYTWMFQYK